MDIEEARKNLGRRLISTDPEWKMAKKLPVVSVFLVMQLDPSTYSDSLLGVYLDRKRAKAFAATHTHGPTPVRVVEWKDGAYGPVL
jgi:hypothetical protein